MRHGAHSNVHGKHRRWAESWEKFWRNLIRPNVLLSSGVSEKLKCGVTQEGSVDPMTPAPISTAWGLRSSGICPQKHP